MKLPFKRRVDDKRGGARENAGRTPTVVVWQVGDTLRIVTPSGVIDATVTHIVSNGALLASEGDEVAAIKLLSQPHAWGVYRKKKRRAGTEPLAGAGDSGAHG